MPARCRQFTSVALAAVLVTSLAGCGLFSSDPDPEEVVADFFGAFASGDTTRAASLTDAPEPAKALLDQVRIALAPQSVDFESQPERNSSADDQATASYQLNWHLPHDRLWSYTGETQLYSVDDGWKVHWQPSVVHPQLAVQQNLAVRVDTPQLAPVLDRDGVALLAPQKVIGVVVDPATVGDLNSVAGQLAAAVGRFDPSVTQQSLVDGVKATKPGGTYAVVSLRDSDYQQVKPAIYELPGVRFTSQDRLLAADKEFAKQVLPSVRSLVDDKVAGRAGWRVVTVDTAGDELAELHAHPAEAAGAITSTLSTRVQTAAEQALDPIPGAAMIVALQPSTGDLLAVAQNAPADAQGPIALAGRYPPGSTFKIITAAAALGTGKVKPDTPVDCPGTINLDGRIVPNEGKFELGTVPLLTAFARSCNTTFAKLATDLPPAALTDAARDLGVGADFVLPGLTTITGSVPPADTVAQRAENGFGQGKVVTSPFGMAIAAATVQSGRISVPTLLRGTPTPAQNLGQPVKPEVLDSLRSMMREVVTTGTATALRGLPDVHGKTGTAQFGDGTNSHGWFVGYQADLAFAVLLVGAGSSKPAVEASDRFLKSLG
ncbi:penicillin-binding transpeptidase domain-containing protein [Amycolatopsis sp.]|uniref:penicillin-binding transpeptidase domain-containing protein n=1 Tax=Amycolatopsis sp. TaxID=37632 RepID=UPI002E057FCC|nr:penicillin-binding transpeptidase domain-containing protein [Amycolatopsis sp.]